MGGKQHAPSESEVRWRRNEVPDSRKHPRKPVPHDIAFQVGNEPRVEATCGNLSLGGVFIETPKPAAYGVPIKVFVRLPGLDQETVIPSTVRWSTHDGMGVQFGVMGARETHALLQLLALWLSAGDRRA